MEGISLQNTKAEIFEAYQAAQKAALEISEKSLEIQNALTESEKKNVELSDKVVGLETKIELLNSEGYEVTGSTQEMTVDPKKVTVVIPYVASLAQGNELQLALRGWAEHFRHEHNIVIIGDREDWMSEMVHVIECERFSTNPPLDVARKMLLAIESDLVTEKFIWANDDQYLISPCMLADFETLKCAGKIGETQFGSSLYQKNKKRTADLLLKNNASTWDFATHIPVVFEKEKLKQMILELNLTEEAYLISTLYFNGYFPEFVPYKADGDAALDHDNLKIGVYRQGANFDRLKKLMPGKKLISNSESGWSPTLSELLNNIFAEKCLYEK